MLSDADRHDLDRLAATDDLSGYDRGALYALLLRAEGDDRRRIEDVLARAEPDPPSEAYAEGARLAGVCNERPAHAFTQLAPSAMTTVPGVEEA